MPVYNVGDVAKSLLPGYKSAFEDMDSAVRHADESLWESIRPFKSTWDESVQHRASSLTHDTDFLRHAPAEVKVLKEKIKATPFEPAGSEADVTKEADMMRQNIVEMGDKLYDLYHAMGKLKADFASGTASLKAKVAEGKNSRSEHYTELCKAYETTESKWKDPELNTNKMKKFPWFKPIVQIIQEANELKRLKKRMDEIAAQKQNDHPILEKWEKANLLLEGAAGNVTTAHSQFDSAMQAAASKGWHIHQKLVEILNDYVQPYQTASQRNMLRGEFAAKCNEMDGILNDMDTSVRRAL